MSKSQLLFKNFPFWDFAGLPVFRHAATQQWYSANVSDALMFYFYAKNN